MGSHGKYYFPLADGWKLLEAFGMFWIHVENLIIHMGGR
jgi:hypothetical protein